MNPSIYDPEKHGPIKDIPNSYVFKRELEKRPQSLINIDEDSKLFGSIIKTKIVAKELYYPSKKTYEEYLGYFDKQKREIELNIFNMYAKNTEWKWLPDYSGETVYNYKTNPPKPKVKAQIIRDKLGREIQIGDLVLYLIQSGNTSHDLNFGKVIGRTNTMIEVEGLEMKNNRKGNKRIANSQSTVLILNDSLFDELVLARLVS